MPERDDKAQRLSQAHLTGVKVIDTASLVAAPFGCMLPGDRGADVVLVDRLPLPDLGPARDPLQRSRRSIISNLKDDADLEFLLRLLDGADVLLEGFCPGVAERPGFAHEICLKRNQAIIQARMTGRGQDGPPLNVPVMISSMLRSPECLG